MLRNKFSFLSVGACGNIDICLVTEAKHDNSSPKAQVHKYGYTNPICLDGGLLLYVSEDIPSKKIDNVDFDTGLEASKKWEQKQL